MSYNKVYENKPIWHNDREPSINETRLNALSNATDIIDNRVIELDEKPLEDISNMQITDLQDGQGIKWNEELQKWENGVVGGIVDITNAEYEYLVEHDLDDRTVTYNITDRNPDGTLIDDSLTQSATKTWSINNLSNKFTAINSNLGQKSEASAVSGDTAFAKINSLNNSLAKSIKFIAKTGTTASMTSIDFTLNGDGGAVLFFNGNQHLFAIANCSVSNPTQTSITKLNGTHTLSISQNGRTFTITSNSTLWGENVVICGNLA